MPSRIFALLVGTGGMMKSGFASRIRTDRLLLRPFAPSDEEALFHLWNDPRVRRFLWDDQPVPRQTVREQIAHSQQDFRERGFGLFILSPVHEPGTVIGAAGLVQLHGADWVEVLYALRPEDWGRGLATEAALALLRFAFEVVGLEEVLAGADVGNVASLRVIERLGMSGEHERVVGPNQVLVRYRRLRREDFHAGEGTFTLLAEGVG